MLDSSARNLIQPIIKKTAKLFIKCGLSANSVTVLALLVGILPAVMLFFKLSTIIVVIILWISGYLDALDGTIARLTNSSSPFGVIMDIVFDRVVEISLIIVLAYRFSANPFVFVLLSCAIILSMTIFLTVAAASGKASEKSFYYQPGLAERTEGFIMFSLMILIPKHIDTICIVFILMVFYTAIQRFVEAYKYFKE